MMEIEEEISLTNVKPLHYGVGSLLRTVSCLKEPEKDAVAFIESNDLSQLKKLLAKVCPLDDIGASSVENGSNKVNFPLPDQHWINQPLGSDKNWLNLLQVAVDQNNLEAAKVLLNGGSSANFYNEELGNSPLLLAVQKKNLAMAKLLLDHLPKTNTARINMVDRNGKTPLHWAAEIDDLPMVKYLMTHPKMENVDSKDLDGQTPLYLAALNGHSGVCELLISYNANLRNECFGKSVLDLISSKLPYFEYSKVRVKDISKAKWDPCNHLSNLLDLAEMNLIKCKSNSPNVLEFKIYLRHLNTEELLRFEDCGMNFMQKVCEKGLDEHLKLLLDKGLNPNAVTDEIPKSPVLLASYNGYYGVIEKLLEYNSNSSKISYKSNSTKNSIPVDFSVQHKGETVLHNILRKTLNDTKSNKSKIRDYEKSFFALMSTKDQLTISQIERVINHTDRENVTPLHYATQLWNQDVVMQLLKLGANIGIRNGWDEVPITHILPETMESFLDEFCLSSENEVTHNDFKLEFNYSFLAPPVNNHLLDSTDIEGKKIVEERALPETEALWYMSQSKPHRYLLNHPVIMSFLWLKWERIRSYFNRNLRFYLLLVICLSWYIFERYGGISARMTSPLSLEHFCSEISSRNNNDEGTGFWYWLFVIHVIVQGLLILRDWIQDCGNCNKYSTVNMVLTSWLEVLTTCLIIGILYLRSQFLWLALTILMVLLLFRELLQMTGSLKRYFFSPENCLEMSMIALVGIILWIPDDKFSDPCTVKRHLAAVSIILSWAELITLVAKHPRLQSLNIYVTMFYRVLTTFFTFLIWYSFFIVAFGFGFYIMLHKDLPGENLAQSEYTFFNYPWLALVKTSTMFVGELEFGDIPIDLDGTMSPMSYIYLLSFIFLIVVVLMNLLNGLAVSDTGLIREEAEIVSAISRVETISYVESLLLGDPFDFLSNWPPFRWIKNIPSLALCRCLYKNKVVKNISLKLSGATGILLFYSLLPNKNLTIFPNKRSAICYKRKVMSEEVIMSAKTIVIRKVEEKRRRLNVNKNENQELCESVKRMEKQLAQLLDMFKIK